MPYGDVEAHEANCDFAARPCAAAARGCLFVGVAADRRAHERACPLVLVTPILDAYDAKVKLLEARVAAQDARIATLERSKTPRPGLATNRYHEKRIHSLQERP